MSFFRPSVRSFIYVVFTPVATLLAFYGLLSEEEIALWGALVLSLVNGGTAIAHRPTLGGVPHKDGGFANNEVVWTIVGILAILALVIYIMGRL